MNFAPPEGVPGQISAVGLALLALAALWLGALSPALNWYDSRADLLQTERQQIAHMAALVHSLPALRASAAAALPAADASTLLPGGSDAIAGANLQSALQTLAAQAGTSLNSTEMLPADNVGSLRRISVAVGVTATWPALIALLAAIDNAHPRCVVDDITINGATDTDPQQALGQEISLQATFTVSAFRASGNTDGGS